MKKLISIPFCAWNTQGRCSTSFRAADNVFKMWFSSQPHLSLMEHRPHDVIAEFPQAKEFMRHQFNIFNLIKDTKQTKELG
jgi:hypothetical protein